MRKGLLWVGFAVLAVAGLLVLWCVHHQNSAKLSLVSCEGQTISIWPGDRLSPRILVYSLSPLDGSVLFRYLDADRHVIAMREIRLDHQETKVLRDRVQVSGVVSCVEGPGDIPSDDPFLLEVRTGRRILPLLNSEWVVSSGFAHNKTKGSHA
ncbi:hypothetical protein [Burkholderia ubonensis]|uniref:hypothetical protein n=1 Tax=Burkholderia ubonensis TaxID=101571 RepID=UPI0012F828D5|nr:hypothetical protein [Burkholderia ubonensis]